MPHDDGQGVYEDQRVHPAQLGLFVGHGEGTRLLSDGHQDVVPDERDHGGEDALPQLLDGGCHEHPRHRHLVDFPGRSVAALVQGAARGRDGAFLEPWMRHQLEQGGLVVVKRQTGNQQVRSLTQFYSVDFSQSRINVK